MAIMIQEIQTSQNMFFPYSRMTLGAARPFSSAVEIGLAMQDMSTPLRMSCGPFFFKLFTWKGSEVLSQESRDLKVQGTCFTLKDGDPYIWKVIM